MPRIFLWIGRSLLILSAVVLITMPVTQHLWTWDRFLHGGQDFESSALMVLTILCLVLVLSKDSRRCIDLLFARWLPLRLKLMDAVPAADFLHGLLSILQIEPAAGSPLSIYRIPLLI